MLVLFILYDLKCQNRLCTGPLTGLLSALQQDDFMPYTKRSAWPFRDTLFSHLSDNIGIEWYRTFNELYRKLSKETEMRLVDLDSVANQWFWDEN